MGNEESNCFLYYVAVSYANDSSDGWLPTSTYTSYTKSNPCTHSGATTYAKSNSNPDAPTGTDTHTKEDSIRKRYC